jgi:hypothetical protein
VSRFEVVGVVADIRNVPLGQTVEPAIYFQARQFPFRAMFLTVNQVIGFVKLFSHEDDKLSFAKYAYKLTSDKSEFYKVADVFAHSFTVDELNEFLDAQD